MEMHHGQKTEQPDFTMFDSAAMLHPFLINSILTGGLREKKNPYFQKENNIGRVGSFFALSFISNQRNDFLFPSTFFPQSASPQQEMISSLSIIFLMAT